MARLALATAVCVISIVLLLLGVGVSYGVIAWSMKARAFAELEEQLHHGHSDFSSMRRYLHILLRPYVQESLQSVDPNLALIPSPDKSTVNALLLSLEYLTQGKYGDLYLQCESLLSSRLSTETQRILINQAEDAKALDESIQSLEREIGVTEQLQNSALQTIKSNASDFADLLSLRAELRHENNSVCPDLYAQGALEGLPTLKGVPDNLESLAELRNVMEQLGGRSKITGPNAYEEFSERLGSIRSSTREARNDCMRTYEKLEQLQPERSELESSLQAKSRRIERILAFKVAALTRPDSLINLYRNYPPVDNIMKLLD